MGSIWWDLKGAKDGFMDLKSYQLKPVYVCPMAVPCLTGVYMLWILDSRKHQSNTAPGTSLPACIPKGVPARLQWYSSSRRPRMEARTPSSQVLRCDASSRSSINEVSMSLTSVQPGFYSSPASSPIISSPLFSLHRKNSSSSSSARHIL